MHIVYIGLTLFALFFGAGNLIFPVMLGQQAGDSFLIAALGFVFTGVLLPLLGVIALAVSGEKDFLKVAQRPGKIFGMVFATSLYLTIGPFFALPRTGSVSFEIILRPFIAEEQSSLYLAIFTIVYFGLACLLAINPSKIIDIVGKILTPIMLLFIVVLITFSIFMPMSDGFTQPIKDYHSAPFFTGFKEGYLTMDTLASFIFGIIVIYSIMGYGIRGRARILMDCIKASLVAALILGIIYISLAYIGADSVGALGVLGNGGQVLAKVSVHYFNTSGNIILGIIVTMACLTTSIGLINACSNYFHHLFPTISYRVFAIIMSVFSAFVANIGLSQLIAISVPILFIIYPISIVMIVLMFSHHLYKGKKAVYIGALYFTLLVSIFDGLNAAGFGVDYVNALFTQYLPLYTVGLGWIAPALLGGMLGYIYSKISKH